MAIDLDDLFGPDAIDAVVVPVAPVIEDEGNRATAIDRYPIIPGHVHFDFFHTYEDIETDRWGRSSSLDTTSTLGNPADCADCCHHRIWKPRSWS